MCTWIRPVDVPPLGLPNSDANSSQETVAGSLQEADGVHLVRITLEEFEAESDVWADPVIAVGQFLLMLTDDYRYWMQLLEEVGCGTE